MARPKPDTPPLLTFLDFFYVVIFGDFVHTVFTKIYPEIPALASPDPLVVVATVALTVVVFWFVGTDWIHARTLTHLLPYQSYRRFFLDLAIAFVSYLALHRALQGAVDCGLYVALIMVGGVVWTVRCLQEERSLADERALEEEKGRAQSTGEAIKAEVNLRPAFRVIAYSHCGTAVVLVLWLLVAMVSQWARSHVVAGVIVIVGLFFYADDLLRVANLDEAVQLGPSAPFLPRKWQTSWIKKVRTSGLAELDLRVAALVSRMGQGVRLGFANFRKRINR